MTDVIDQYRPKLAGWIVFRKNKDAAIEGSGKTQHEAWMDFESRKERAGVHVFNPAIDIGMPLAQPFVRVDDYTIKPASRALLDEVSAWGEAVKWGRVGQIRCTTEELQTFLRAEEAAAGDG